MKRIPVLLGAVLLGLATRAAAQTAAPLALTLDEAVRRGVEAAPRVAAAKAREAAATSSVAVQAAGRRPTATAQAGYLRTNHVDAFGLTLPDGSFRTIFPDIPDNYQARAEVDVPVYTGGRVDALVSSAKASVSAASADRKTTEADIRLEVATAYWSLVTARESVTVLENAVARADAAVSDARARVDAGFLPPSALLSAQAERAREAVRLIDARHAAALGEVVLDRLLGADLGQAIVTTSKVTDPDPAVATLAAKPTGDLVTQARATRSELVGLKAQAAALDASAEASVATLHPFVGALGTVQPARPNPLFIPRVDQWKTSWSLGVNVTWSFLDGGRARAQAATATSQAEAIRQQSADVSAGMAVELRQRLLDLEADQAAIVASADAVSAATEAHRVVAERFRAGVASSTEVLDAEVALLEASLEHTQLSAAARIDEARLRRAIGVDR
jgi:outer membrane protein TolC